MRTSWLPLLLAMLPAWGCHLSSSGPPTQAEPLEDMEVSRARFAMPQDEAQRQELPRGVFTGIEVGDARQTLEAQLSPPEGLLVTAVVENSPAVAADIRAGDILLEAAIDHGEPVTLSWPSDWYRIEETASVNGTIELLVDRAGRDRRAVLKPVKRISLRPRLPGQHYREERKVGIIVRNASEVEAHQAGLARGEGAVVVGLAQTSPWRQAGVQLGDVITDVNGTPVKNPQELLAAINDLPLGRAVRIGVFREGEKVTLQTTVSRRKQETAEVRIPLLYTYENKRGIRKSSVLMGLFRERQTAVAAEYTVLWFIKWTVGDSNRLEQAP
jgi:S1-C subfamily serine protease